MEFLRFGSSIPGSYWGCCAMCIVQDFSGMPDDSCSIQLVCGDGGQPLGDKFLGMTNREVFESRLRIGTFSDGDLPDHGFLAIMTRSQLRYETGKAWLEVLKENGFEFIRAVDNSVYSGDTLATEVDDFVCDSDYCEGDCDCYPEGEPYPNYLFGLFRNIGSGQITDPFTPPEEWTSLEGGVKDAVSFLTEETREGLNEAHQQFHEEQWNRIGPAKIYTKKKIEEAGIKVILAGKRSEYLQEPEEDRQKKEREKEGLKQKAAPAAPAFEVDMTTPLTAVT